MSKLDFRKYIELVYGKQCKKADRYREECMPKTLYKYVSLNGLKVCPKDKEKCSNDSILDELKMEALKKRSVWLSKFEYLNDPFEYKGMKINYSEA